MNGNLNPSMAAAVAGVINPVSQAAGTVTTGWVDMQKFGTLLAILAVGALGADATVNAKIEQATDNAGAGAKDVAGLAITALTKAGTDDNKQVLVNLRQEDLDKNNAFRFARLSVTVGTAASLISAVLLGFNARYGAATDNDATTVDEIVS
ncbi:hypothetical protein [Sphingobium sp. Cam5-1]|uniref:hypothetical protein n=1 Tax=Sphingobium sp. Cam5-1 TaxID=2789327 RepID=UPI0018AD20D2|nr:hypothetical protein [Sphingobium sp. Cam5-1]QPI73926.1 hypothetical protein IZV00_05535 [Sphingobium sp. Cam5-1]